MKIKLSLTFFCLLIFLPACSSSNRITPDGIGGHVFEVNTTKAKGDDEFLLHETILCYFNTNGSYYSKIDGKIFHTGDYAYHVMNDTQARIVYSYTYDKDNTVYHYVNILNFDNPNSGTWTGSYYNDSMNAEEGTFRIIHLVPTKLQKHP